MNLRRGLARLAIVLWALWFIYWTFAYVAQPRVSESAPAPTGELSLAAGIALIAGAFLGLWWIFAGFRSN